MSYLFLIPAFLSLYFVARRRLDLALLWVYLPTLILLPTYYHFHIPHIPAFSAAQGALFPLGIAAAVRWLRGPFKRMDLWVVMFMVSIWLSEYYREPHHLDGILFAITSIEAMLFSYIVGRALIEPTLRLRVAKQAIVLALIQAPLLLWEFRMGVNLYEVAATRFFNVYDAGWGVQIRGGHGRASGAFSDAELAGLAFSVFLLLNAWLIQINRADLENHRPPRLGGFFSRLERYWIPAWILLALLGMTESRGPALGLIGGLLILMVGRFERKREQAMTAVAIVLIGGILTVYAYYSTFTAVNFENMTEEQGSVVYRLLLSQNYKPIVEQGGWLGWGSILHPVPAGQNSVDNAYLLIHVSYGRLGILCFYLIVLESLWGQSRSMLRMRNKDDFLFAVSLLATLATIWIIITTVYLGEQLPQITFLLLGWGQSLTASREDAAAPASRTVVEERQPIRVFS